MAESTFDAKVFLLGSGSTSFARAGGAKPVDIGGLLAQPARPRSTPKIAKRRIVSTARSSMLQPPRFPPAMALTLWPWPNLYPREACWQAQKAGAGICPPQRGSTHKPNRRPSDARRKCRANSPAFTSAHQRNHRAGALEKSVTNARAPRTCAHGAGPLQDLRGFVRSNAFSPTTGRAVIALLDTLLAPRRRRGERWPWLPAGELECMSRGLLLVPPSPLLELESRICARNLVHTAPSHANSAAREERDHTVPCFLGGLLDALARLLHLLDGLLVGLLGEIHHRLGRGIRRRRGRCGCSCSGRGRCGGSFARGRHLRLRQRLQGGPGNALHRPIAVEHGATLHTARGVPTLLRHGRDAQHLQRLPTARLRPVDDAAIYAGGIAAGDAKLLTFG